MVGSLPVHYLSRKPKDIAAARIVARMVRCTPDWARRMHKEGVGGGYHSRWCGAITIDVSKSMADGNEGMRS